MRYPPFVNNRARPKPKTSGRGNSGFAVKRKGDRIKHVKNKVWVAILWLSKVKVVVTAAHAIQIMLWLGKRRIVRQYHKAPKGRADSEVLWIKDAGVTQ